MILIGLIGLSICAAGVWLIPGESRTMDRRTLFALAALHVAASLSYWQYAQAYGADTRLYYFGGYGIENTATAPGTIFTVQLVQAIKSALGGAYVEYFLLFQSLGFIGIALVYRTFAEIAEDLGQELGPLELAVLFLPGLHFWTSAIGKDAPLFLASAMCIWSMLHLHRRFPVMIAGIALMYPFRPHIAAVAIVALMIALVFGKRVHIGLRTALIAGALGGTFFVLGAVQELFKMDEISLSSIDEFIAGKQQFGMRSAGGALLASLPLPLKVASLLFRPFFFDAGGMLGVIVSFENLVMLFIFGTIAWHARTLWRLCREIPYLRFALIFAVVMIVTLGLVVYNVGLGLRQKFMFMPAVLVIFVSIRLYVRATKTPQTQGVAGTTAGAQLR
jgi:hypothetical protein